MIPKRVVISDSFLQTLQSWESWLLRESNWKCSFPINYDPLIETSVEKLQTILDQGRRVDVPESSYGVSCINPINVDKFTKLNMKSITDRLSTKFRTSFHIPLITYYPPKGFLGWHTNYIVPGPFILFTWSETGSGYLRYRNPYTKEIETIRDLKGWDCKVGCWEPDPENEVWHSAMTECRRLSFGFRFSKDKWVEAVKTI